MKQVSSFRMVLTMTLVAALCGAMIVTAYLYTAPLIERNKALVLQEAILAICPGSAEIRTIQDSPGRFFLAYDKEHTLQRIAIEAQGQGFADQVRVIYALDPRSGRIAGFKVVESKETPGIGDKILSDSAFLANFDSLDVSQPIVAVKHGYKVLPHEIDGITGATISSKAVARLLQASQKEMLPRAMAYWDSLQQQEQNGRGGYGAQ